MNSGRTIGVVIVAAGRSARFGGEIPKQYQPLLGQSVLARTVQSIWTALPDALIQPVIGEGDADRFRMAVAGLGLLDPVVGGETRQASVLRGLEALTLSDYVLIHDAARPFVDGNLVQLLLEIIATGEADAAAPGIKVHDSLKRCDDDGVVLGSVDRAGLWHVQTPQIFRHDAILQAHRSAKEASIGTDDLALAEHCGLKVKLVSGREDGFKITTPDDLRRAEQILLQRAGDVRTGNGFDVHAFGDGDSVTLCGVKVPFARGLVGHSDADVGLHALTDAILGAIGAQDIGTHFPPSDPQWRGRGSEIFLRKACDLVEQASGLVAHVDVTLICEAPKIAPHRDAMIARIADIMRLPAHRVSVKATTTERLGFTGRREGIAALATATVRLPL